MSNRIDKTFNSLRQENRKAFIPFTVLGYPDRETSLTAIQTMIDNGADVLELGLPFSDPMADGQIIESASKAVVETGFTTGDALELIASIRERNKNIPIVIMSYFNLALARGIEKFMKDLNSAGADGITFVDLPPEEGESVFTIAKENGIAPVMLVSPLTSPERLTRILAHASGYLYLISRAGTTGIAEKFDDKLSTLIAMLRSQSQLPVCIGFGISKPEHVTKMLDLGADGVVVGSKLVEILKDLSLPDPKTSDVTTHNPNARNDLFTAAVKQLVQATAKIEQCTSLQS
ncbi:MAG: tryptophan synthase subunit alpha [Candidatus Melainabacteria bacterium]|nr:tryptophan synthase subunit alpha [Candidatus Melainabacteria bacterium]